MVKKCVECVYSIHRDYGDSNYTVEGTELFCAKNTHPRMPFDRFYGEDKRVLFAENCEHFLEGDGVFLDVDLELAIGSAKPTEERYSSYATLYVSSENIAKVVE